MVSFSQELRGGSFPPIENLLHLQLQLQSFFYFNKICSYSLNIYKTIPQNSITSFLKKKSQKDAVLEHSNSKDRLKKYRI